MKMQLNEDIHFHDDPEAEERLNAALGWKAMMEMVERREAAAKQVSPCESCGSIQVQLVDWSTPQLKMKCRICKHKFIKELK